jgi:WD40 repeat protein
MHIYHSALPFAPMTPLWKIYRARDYVHEPKVLQGLETQWRSLIRTVQVSSPAMAIEYSHDGSMLAVGGDGYSRLLHSATGERRAKLDSDCGWVVSVSFSCDDQTLATASDNGICLWDINTGSCVAELDIDDAEFCSVAFHPYIKHSLAAGDRLGHIHVWDVRDTSHSTDIDVEESFNCLCWIRRDGSQHVVIGREYSIVEMWDVESSQQVRVFPSPPFHHPRTRVQVVACSHDGQWVASCSSSGGLVIYDTETGAVAHTFKSPQAITSAMFSPTEPILAVGSLSTTIRCFHLESNATVSLDGARDWVRSVAFSPDGRFIASASDDRAINIWETIIDDSSVLLDAHHSRSINDVHFSHDGTLIVSVSEDKTAKVWDASTGTLYTTFKGHKDGVWDATILPDNVHVVSVDSSGTLILWDWRQPEGKVLCSSETWNHPQILPYPRHAHDSVFFSAHKIAKNKHQVNCWFIESLNTDSPRMVLVANGFVPSVVAQIGFRGSTDTRDLKLAVKLSKGKQYLAQWEDPTSVPEKPQELDFVEDTEQSPAEDVSVPLTETVSYQSKDDTWISNGHRWILWVPAVNRGHRAYWHGRKLVMAGNSGRLTLLDFSSVNDDIDSHST